MKKDFTYIIAEKIYNYFFLKSDGRSFVSEKVKKAIFHLYPGACEKELKKYYIEKIRLIIVVEVFGGLISIIVLISSRINSPIVDNEILRNDYLRGTQEIEATVTHGDDVNEILLSIGERTYTESQLDAFWEEMRSKLEQTVLGENERFDHITKNLNLVTSLNGYPFSIAWECRDYRLLDSDGILQKDKLTDDGQVTTIKAILTYDDYCLEYSIPICVYLAPLTPQEKFQKELNALLESTEESTKYDESFTLPSTLNNQMLIWSAPKDQSWIIILGFTVIISVILYFFKDQDLEKSLKERENQMIADYPEMISKLAIYMGAGMSARLAWEKIVTDYEKKRAAEKRYLYEEMWIALQEMKSGISEVAAYDRFGKRCNVQIYIKFSNLLIQNLRKGSTGLSALLREESRLAFSERKNYARKKGEEAGTKLLLPMMLMLCLVMIMIMLPAFLTF